MRAFVLLCFCAFILLFLGFIFSANAKESSAAKQEKKAEFSGSKLVEKIKQPKKPGDKSTNEVWIAGRTFPLMFDIADRSRKHKAGKK